MHRSARRRQCTGPARPSGAVPLSEYVKAPAELRRRLAQIGVVARAKAATLAKALKAGQRLVSREGDLWRWDGFAAAAHAPTGAARRLAERGRLQMLESELAAARSDCEAKRRMLEQAEAALAAAAAAEGTARAAEREIGRNAARVSALTEARQRIITARDENMAGHAAAEQALMKLEAADQIEKELAAVSEVIAREAQLAQHRLAATGEARQAWSERGDSAAAQIATLGQRTDEASAERSELTNMPQKFAAQRQALIGEIEAATATRKAAADRLAEAETEVSEADKLARAALEAVGEARAEAARGEERHEGARRRLADIEHEIHELLQVEPAATAELAELKPDAALPSIAEVEAKIDRIKQERERLGSVNLLAEQELRDVEGQHGKLMSERDDLIEAIRRLRQGIHSLNHEARERLLASFQIVNNNFKNLFSELFGGGTAELQLIEHDDPLEAGLEIMAKPPGKKPATLSLLSGGEQALTALALIFAVFLTNPAPICILDEVDAPLDDYNVERFCDLLDEMTRATDTRFVIITHNPITMARMNRLYGVTMAERGVSQLVSVDLEGAVKLREAS